MLVEDRLDVPWVLQVVSEDVSAQFVESSRCKTLEIVSAHLLPEAFKNIIATSDNTY